MKKPIIILVCGVQGSGKSWICERLEGLNCNYVRHDHFIKDDAGYINALKVAAQSGLPVLTDCPFAERVTKEKLEAAGFEVRPYFIVEDPLVVMDRYRKRTGKNLQQAGITRATTIKNRAVEWSSPYGTSQEMHDKIQVDLMLEARHGGGRAYS